LAAAAAIAVSVPVHAAVTFDAVAGVDGRSYGSFSWQGAASGGVLTTSQGNAAKPWGTVVGEDFMAAGGGVGTPAYLDLGSLISGAIDTFTFVWGSVDAVPNQGGTNILDILGANDAVIGTITGAQIASYLGTVGDGNQTEALKNPTVTLHFNDLAGQVTKLKLYNNPDSFNAFEITPLALAGGVPEPGTWALMILGFGLVGGALRRRQRQSVRYSFA
jgi:hypothetical protein